MTVQTGWRRGIFHLAERKALDGGDAVEPRQLVLQDGVNSHRTITTAQGKPP